MPNIRTACPRLEVFTFCWALLSLSLFPASLSPPPPTVPPSLCGGGQSTGRNEGLGRTPEHKERNTVAWSLTESMSRTKEVTWPADWIWGMNRAMIDQDHTWWRERECVWAVAPTWRQTERVGVQPGGQGQHVPNKHGEKTINRTFTAGEKYGGSCGGLLRRKITGKWPSSSESLRASPMLLNIVCWELWGEGKKTWEIPFFPLSLSFSLN